MRQLLIALSAFAVASTVHAQVAPDKCLSTFTVADGLQIELFAAEPMLINPTSIDIDHKGRVWVCEAVNYRRLNYGRPIIRPEGDRIQVLIDETGEGKATKAVTFYQGKEIVAPLGIAVAPYPSPDRKGGISYKVFVCQSPDILVFEDKDGDLKADGPPKKLLTGFNGIDHDHGVHGINIGPDGKLYFTVGDAGVKNLQSSDGKGPKFTSNSTDCRAGTVWRCDMDGTHLELIAHNFRNNYECCVNSFGEIWLSDNDDDGNQQTRICYVMPGGNYGYHPRGPGQSHWHEEQPGIVHKVLRTGFGSPTGIVFYEGTLLPKKYQGQLLHCDAGPREFRCFHIKPKGAGYELEKENLVTSTDNWFRLSAVRVAPDGSVMLADWYDPGVGGHGMGDWTRGRIYRITPKGHKGYKVPEAKLETKDGLRDALASPCLATRTLAHVHLAHIGGTKEFMAAIGLQLFDEVLEEKRLKGTPINELLVARAAWILSRYVDKRLRKSDRIYNTFILAMKLDGPALALYFRIWSDLIKRDYKPDDPEAWLPFEDFLSDKPKFDFRPKVGDAYWPALREWLCGAERMNPDFDGARLYKFSRLYDGQDRFYLAALNIACGTDPKRRDAILADFDKHFPEWNDKVADLVWELRPKSVLPRLEKLLADGKLTDAQKGRIVDILAVNDNPEAGKAMLKLFMSNAPANVKARALENLRLFLPTKWKELQHGDAVRDAIADSLKHKDRQLVGLQLAAAAPDCATIEDIETLAKDAKAAAEVRSAAVRVIGKSHHVKFARMLKPLIADPVVGPSVVAALGEFVSERGVNSGAKEALEILQGLVLNADSSPDLRKAAISALTGTQPGSQWLIKLKEGGKMPEALVADAGKLLRNSPYQGLRNKALLLFPAPGKLDPKKLPPITSLAKRLGNPIKGKQLMAASLKGETQCLRCHTVRGVGGNIGPDLSMIGKKASKENLIESILLPSKAIADQYLQWTIENAAGQKITGLLVEETPAGLTIRDANGKDTKIAKADIESRTKSLVSIMPEDIVKGFTEDDLIDVVEYLFTLKTPSLTPDTWHILGPFPNDANDSGLDAVYGPEEKHDLSAIYKGKSGAVKWQTVKHNGTGYVDLAAHFGGESANIASYLYQQIESPVDQDATILIGNDDGCKIWLNGNKVFENRDHLAATPERNKAPVKLKKGVNTVLMKIVNGNNPHGFYLSVTSEQELKIK